MECQLWETICISNAKFNVLNVKDSYNRCRVPTIHTEDWKKNNRKAEENGLTKLKNSRFLPAERPEAKRMKIDTIEEENNKKNKEDTNNKEEDEIKVMFPPHANESVETGVVVVSECSSNKSISI